MRNWSEHLFTLTGGKRPRVFRLPAFVALLSIFLFVSTTLAASAPATPTIYYACVNNTTGAIRIVGSTTRCASNEHKIQWNQQGPAGPAGPQGPQGPSGVSQGYTAFNGPIVLGNTAAVPVVSTIAVTAGTYIVIGMEESNIDTGDGVYCVLGTVHTGGSGLSTSFAGYVSAPQYETQSLTEAFTVAAGDQFELFCGDQNNDAKTSSWTAWITAIQLNQVSMHTSGSRPARPFPKHP